LFLADEISDVKRDSVHATIRTDDFVLDSEGVVVFEGFDVLGAVQAQLVVAF